MATAMAFPSPDTSSVATLMASTDAVSDVLVALHLRVQQATSAACTVLLELAADTGLLHPTSGRGLDHLAVDPWCTDEVSRAFASAVLATGRPRPISPITETCPTLARQLKTPAAYLAPVRFAGDPLGLLVLGLSELTPPLAWAGAVSDCAAGFALVLTAARLRHDLALQTDVGALVGALGQDRSPTLSAERLRAFCTGVARVFAAEAVELWRHDRDRQLLHLMAQSVQSRPGQVTSIDAGDADGLVSAALRRQNSSVVSRDSQGAYALPRHTATVPLRGRRRALGVLVVDGLRLGPGDAVRLLPHCDALGRQLAALLESTHLLDDVIRARRELENTFDSMRDPLVVCAFDGHILRANEAFARLAGQTRGSLKSRRLSELVDPTLGLWLDRAMYDAQDRDRRSQTTEHRDERTGTILHVSVAPLAARQDLAAGFVVLLRDVTEESRLESERAALRERLAQSETLGHLIAGIAHELNNPLQAVTGHVELVRRTRRLGPEADSQLALVHREADRAARIVRNLLLLAGSGRIVSHPVSVNAAVRRALANRRAAWRAAGIRVSHDLDSALPRVAGDALLLQQAILNVLLNAEQALGDRGGRIEIRTALDPARRRVEVRVLDDGQGIPADVLPHVFDPFFTTKEAGRGLGLALVLRIAHEHGGDVEVRPVPTGGTEFLLYLPVPPVIK
ncbi:MAG: ATP-binding protein [Acidobacteriota bacterium]